MTSLTKHVSLWSLQVTVFPVVKHFRSVWERVSEIFDLKILAPVVGRAVLGEKADVLSPNAHSTNRARSVSVLL